jgi:hypothetical protein
MKLLLKLHKAITVPTYILLFNEYRVHAYITVDLGFSLIQTRQN